MGSPVRVRARPIGGSVLVDLTAQVRVTRHRGVPVGSSLGREATKTMSTRDRCDLACAGSADDGGRLVRAVASEEQLDETTRALGLSREQDTPAFPERDLEDESREELLGVAVRLLGVVEPVLLLESATASDGRLPRRSRKGCVLRELSRSIERGERVTVPIERERDTPFDVFPNDALGDARLFHGATSATEELARLCVTPRVRCRGCKRRQCRDSHRRVGTFALGQRQRTFGGVFLRRVAMGEPFDIGLDRSVLRLLASGRVGGVFEKATMLGEEGTCRIELADGREVIRFTEARSALGAVEAEPRRECSCHSGVLERTARVAHRDREVRSIKRQPRSALGMMNERGLELVEDGFCLRETARSAAQEERKREQVLRASAEVSVRRVRGRALLEMSLRPVDVSLAQSNAAEDAVSKRTLVWIVRRERGRGFGGRLGEVASVSRAVRRVDSSERALLANLESKRRSHSVRVLHDDELMHIRGQREAEQEPPVPLLCHPFG